MPGEGGLALAREIGGRGTAIIMLTASGGVVDRVVGLELGADDYIAKPFDPRELLARIKSVLRRVKPALPDASAERRTLRFGRHLLDLEARKLFALDGREVAVTAMEFDLLEAFARNPNRVLSRDRLLDLAHRGTNDPFDRSIDTRVARLRQKIEPHPGRPHTIKTVRGVGYMFVPAPRKDRPTLSAPMASAHPPMRNAPGGRHGVGCRPGKQFKGLACRRASRRSLRGTPGGSPPSPCRCCC